MMKGLKFGKVFLKKIRIDGEVATAWKFFDLTKKIKSNH